MEAEGEAIGVPEGEAVAVAVGTGAVVDGVAFALPQPATKTTASAAPSNMGSVAL